MRLAARPVARRALVSVLVLTTLAVGLLGAFDYGQAYSLHRGFAPIARLARAGKGRLVTVHFYSQALHRRADYLVYLPPGYSPHGHYPVFYLLHGAPGAPDAFTTIVALDVRLANRMSQQQLRPMLLVMPDGRINGNTFSDSEWANTSAGRFESYVVDVVHNVDHRFATIASRQDRVIGGYSAGAYGAINIALHQLRTFGNVQVWSGYFLQTRDGVFAHASRATLDYNSPLIYARTLGPRIAANPVRLYLFTGRADPAAVQLRPMVTELARDGAVVSYNIFPGGHDWEVWYSRVDSLLLLASRMMSDPLPAPAPPPAAHRTRARALVAVHPRRRTPPTRPAARPPRTPAAASVRARGHRGLPTQAWLGLALALMSAALINLGFLLQHRGVAGAPAGVGATLRQALRSPTWLAGQGLGWTGFALQILAIGLAPLSLVQAFAAGGLALSVPLAALLFRHRVVRAQALAVATIAACLAILPLGVPAVAARMHGTAMAAASVAVFAAGALIAWLAHPAARAIAAGLFYGGADAAIKAVTTSVHLHGAGGLASAWTAVAVLGTVAGFLAFQAALRAGNAVNAVSLMTAAATMIALAFGVLAFGESLGGGPALVAVHLLAVAVVLACLPPLMRAGDPAAGERIPGPDDGHTSLRRTLVVVARSVLSGVLLVLAVVAGTGLLYLLRGQVWLAAGPRVGDALPLLQLAQHDAQPLSLVVLAWAPVGLVAGAGLMYLRPRIRPLAAGLPGLVLVLCASEASYALARNARLVDVLPHRVPGAGAWLEVLILALAAALPRRGRTGWRPGSARLAAPVSRWTPSDLFAGRGTGACSGS